jgi:chorismate synthase
LAFKPVATILKTQETIDIEGHPTLFKAQGRHDPCVLPRAVPIVESMAAMVILDCILSEKATKL